jgi:ribonuclease VapC
MIVDSSAIVAMLREEPGHETLRAKLLGAARPARMSAASYLESAIVIDAKRNPFASRGLDQLIDAFKIEIEPVTAEHARIARAAYRDFGKGSGHPAQLNFGDCFAYALASDSDQPLLFKGNDFIHTDLREA